MPAKRFYDEDEAEQILKLASKKMSGIGSISGDELVRTASELGITPDALQEAEEEFERTRTEQQSRQNFDRYTRKEFLSHLVFYLVINGALMALDLRSDGKLGWSYYPLILWGIGILAQAWSTFARSSEDYEKEFRSWRRRQDRKSLKEGSDDYGSVMEEIASEFSIESRKVEAIKQLRERTGLDLKDAKDVVEAYVSQRS